MKGPDPVAIGTEIETVVARLREQADSGSAADAQQLVRLVMSFHGAGLSRLADMIRTDVAGGHGLFRRLASDPLVASLLALHDLQPGSGDERLLQIMPAAAPPAPAEHARPEDRCELCAAELPAGHAHLLDVESRRLLCACATCRTVGGRYRVVPSRYIHLPSMAITPAEWEAFGIPVGLVFFVLDSHRGRTAACYPGPAGATESLLPLEAWPVLADRHPWLQRLAPDVEALLVRRIGGEYRCYIVPIDACYELIGCIRKAWAGIGGGPDVEREIDRFFAGVLRKAEANREVSA